MKLIIYSVFARLTIGVPLVEDSTNSYPTTTTVDSYPVGIPTNTATTVNSYPVSLPTDVATPIDSYQVSNPAYSDIPPYTLVPEPTYTGRPHQKWNHRHKHHHKHHHMHHNGNNRYHKGSQNSVVGYPAETIPATGNVQSDSGSSSTSVYAPTSDNEYINDSSNFNTEDPSNDDATDTATAEDTANDDTLDTPTADNTADSDTTDTGATNYATSGDTVDNSTAGDTTTGSTSDPNPSATATVAQSSSSPTPLPDFYSQIQASSFGDV